MNYKQHYLRGYSRAFDFFKQAAFSLAEKEQQLNRAANDYMKAHGYSNGGYDSSGAPQYEYYAVPEEGLNNIEYQSQDAAWQQKIRREKEIKDMSDSFNGFWDRVPAFFKSVGNIFTGDFDGAALRASLGLTMRSRTQGGYNKWKEGQSRAWARDVSAKPYTREQVMQMLRDGTATTRFMALPVNNTLRDTRTQLQHYVGLLMNDQAKRNWINRNDLIREARRNGIDPWWGWKTRSRWDEWLTPDSKVTANRAFRRSRPPIYQA